MAIGKLSLLLSIVSVSLMSNIFWRIAKIFFLYELFLPFSPEVYETKKLLVIGVMSAQDHYKERETIRNTWGRLIDHELIDIKFLIGSRTCHVPPDDRITTYVCEKWDSSSSLRVNSSVSSNINISYQLSEGYTGFSFIIKHNISVVKLGIHSQIFKNGQCKRARVVLFDAASGDKMASATFIGENYSFEGFLWKNIRRIRLSEDFEGELKLITDQQINVSCFSNIANTGVVHIFEVIKNNTFIKFKKPCCMLPAFIYLLENEQNLAKFISKENFRKINWEKEMETIQYQLYIESKAYNDIIFFDFIDIYKNLTLKLFEFLKWTQNNNRYKYILKTDDDVFLDINRISSVLITNVNGNWDWWSCFRQKCPPPNYGKWRDRLFNKHYYPPFPSGAGYVITDKIASLIISNNSIEEITAGEDVALGIWIHKSSRSYPKILNTSSAYWACGITCPVVRPCNVPELSWQEMYDTLHRLVSFKSICP